MEEASARAAAACSPQAAIPPVALCPVCTEVPVEPLAFDCACGVTTACRWTSDGCRICHACVQQWFDTYATNCMCMFCHKRLPRRGRGKNSSLRYYLNVPLWHALLATFPAAVQRRTGWDGARLAQELAAMTAELAAPVTGRGKRRRAAPASAFHGTFTTLDAEACAAAVAGGDSASPPPARLAAAGAIRAEWEAERDEVRREQSEHSTVRTLRFLLDAGDGAAAGQLLAAAEADGSAPPEQLAPLKAQWQALPAAPTGGHKRARRGVLDDLLHRAPRATAAAKKAQQPAPAAEQRPHASAPRLCTQCGSLYPSPLPACPLCKAGRSLQGAAAAALFARAFKPANPWDAARMASALAGEPEVLVLD